MQTCFSSARLTPFGSRLPALLVAAALGVRLIACRTESAPEPTAPSREPERFSFVLPSDYQMLELRGEGSETLRVPASARVTRSAKAFRVEAGDEFALDVISDAAPLRELVPASVARVLSESDVTVFTVSTVSTTGQRLYAFAVVRELVPEWDDGQRQRWACGSAGGGVSGSVTGATRGFSKASVERMVAACRTLELPKLE